MSTYPISSSSFSPTESSQRPPSSELDNRTSKVAKPSLRPHRRRKEGTVDPAQDYTLKKPEGRRNYDSRYYRENREKLFKERTAQQEIIAASAALIQLKKTYKEAAPPTVADVLSRFKRSRLLPMPANISSNSENSEAGPR